MKIKKYNHKKIEKKIQKFWYKNKIFKSNINYKKKKYYCLSMIPYPSGNLHIGHVRNYIIGDIISRYKRLNNKNVLHPIGWDSFGLPAENAAINHNISPNKWTIKNIKNMKKQLKKLGISYDWDREIITSNSKFYKWEQWLFIKLFKNNLIYKKKDIVNWCSYDKTVLANEQVINNKCWRCNNKIKYKYINQWFIKITKYSNILLKDINKLKYWPKKVKNMQINWIGKCKGYKIKFKISNYNKKIKLFIKKIQLITAITYICISINNKINKKIKNIKKKIKYIFSKNNNIKKYKKYFLIKTKLLAINPITKEKLPIIITNFTNELYNYDSLPLIPGYSKKQYKFAKYFNLKIKYIFKTYKNNLNKKILINSGILDNLSIKKSKNLIKKILKIKKKKYYIFKLKDWIISRQRYWGVPIPIIKNNKLNIPINYNKLPIKLPKNLKINIKNKLNPLKFNNKWKKIKINNKLFIKETDTIDTFLESSWYHIRFTSPNSKNYIFNIEKANYWLPIDVYIGGIEHATMHLIYLRFIHKFLYNLGLIKYSEPVKKLICQGMVLSKTFYYLKKKKKIWINYKNVTKIKKTNKIYYFKKNTKTPIIFYGIKKMSKSKNNGVKPNNIINKYGADTLRLFIIFSSPIEKNLIWNDKNIKGCYRFLNKIYNISFYLINIKINTIKYKKINKKYKKIKFYLNKTIYKVNKNIKKNYFNIAISEIMKFIKKFNKFKILNKKDYLLYKKCINFIIILIYPFTPHISFYIWKKLNNKNIIDNTKWPKYSKKKLIKKNIKLIVQINGKTKYIIKIKNKLDKNKIKKIIYKKKIINRFIINKKIKKIIYIKNKVINFLIK